MVEFIETKRILNVLLNDYKRFQKMNKIQRLNEAFSCMTIEAQDETLKFIEMMAKNYSSKSRGVYLAYSEISVSGCSAVSSSSNKASTNL